MARDKPPAKWDVWFVAADQVYRGVPTDVAAGWAGQGRLAAADKLRPSGTAEVWRAAADVPGVGGFLYQVPAAGDGPADAWPDLETDPPPRRQDADDDEVDMIPLIDVSLVLLVFFMLTTTVSTLSAVDVPEMTNVSQISPEGTALVLQVDNGPDGKPVYAVRVGDAPPAPDDANLPTPAALFARLDARLSGSQDPPPVRIACAGKLDGDLAWGLTPELDRRQKAGRIRSYTADVTEATK